MNNLIKRIVMISLLVIYIIAANTNEWLADFISPVYLFVVFSFIITALNHFGKNKISYALLAWLIFIWAVLDVVWFVMAHYTKIDPNEIYFFDVAFIIPNILLCTAALIYFKTNIKKWSNYQLVLDTTVVGIIVLGMASGLILSKLSPQDYGIIDYIVTVSYTFTDVIALTILLVMIASSRVQGINKTLKFVVVGFILYIFSDVLYMDSDLNGEYLANSISDILFMVSFLHFGIGALLRAPIAPDEIEEVPYNFGKSYVIWYVLLVPSLLFVLGRISPMHMVVFIIVIFIYLLFSYFAQKSILSELLLQKEQDMNKELERLVEEKTFDLRRSKDALERKSITDSLTTLFNRDYFYEIAEEEIRLKQPFSIIYSDLDRFKVLNDLHGHQMGDQVLKVIAKRLSRSIDIACDLFRVGGDEFAIILRSTDDKTVELFCQNLISLISKPVHISDYEFVIDTSIGIARYPMDGDHVIELVKHADIAMYHAKSLNQRNRHVWFSEHMLEKMKRRNKIELLLKKANFDEEFELYYQPQIDATSGHLTGMEALLRWHHPEEGFIPPGEFIPISEEIGLILKISDWVFEQGMIQCEKWQKAYGSNFVLGLNLSPATVNNIHFFENLRQLIQKTDVAPQGIEFEITEHTTMSTATIMEEVFATLTSLGFGISIDDFGTGYSSLSYLKRFDVDRLKIAKELIDNIADKSDDRIIVSAIIMMAKGMGLTTIGEGVETLEQLEILQSLGCDIIQGYYYGTPMPAEHFERTYFNETYGF